MIVVGLWGPDSLANAQTGCVSQGAVSASETALAADCEVLLSARGSLEGKARLNWSAGTPIEDWEGISVGGAPLRVVGIRIGNRGLTGTIPSELGNLSGLAELSLLENELSGPIPGELGGLANLTRLLLSENELTGPIPSELGNLANLTRLLLSENELTGPIPSELGNLANLTRLLLS